MNIAGVKISETELLNYYIASWNKKRNMITYTQNILD